ncbi:surface-adhesin E family protein [Burkholderia lata]|uniref:surface-adhesin E family protein n=1 Tax=Burkholderia lata (strain ATCC 17760 / DSM 23089 / LMG 22485 / NCIMB 9086 / R18194 / 383) TaxID=482957 RepID=UPI0015842890|nr:surface-adhesin E family protein [Burkholderia lata]
MKTVGGKMKCALIFITLASITTAAFASSWVPVLNENEYTMGVDSETYKANGDNRDFWTKQDYKKTQKTSSGKPYISIVAKWHINCANDTWSAASISYYDKLGRIVITATGTGTVDITPDTIAQVVERAVCK